MKRLLLTTCLAWLLVTPVHPATPQLMFDEDGAFVVLDAPSEWGSVSNDTCTPKANCTADWAFTTADKRGLLPEAVAREAIRRFAVAEAALADDSTETVPDWHEFQVGKGWNGFMSFAEERQRYFADNITAEFTKPTLAYGWIIRDSATGIDYQVVRVKACGNYGGRVMPRIVAGLVDSVFGEPVRSTPVSSEPRQLVSFDPKGSTPWGGTTPPGGGGCRHDCVPAPIPLPASHWPLLAALATLGGASWSRRRRLAA